MAKSSAEFKNIFDGAWKAGEEAVAKLSIAPMVVSQHANPLDDNSAVVNAWVVPDGPCGFAWINVKPGTSAFAKWLKENDLASKDSYYGGVCIWIDIYNQSILKKEAHAYAMANYFTKLGIKSYASSRMD